MILLPAGSAAPDGNSLGATVRETVYAGATSTFLLAGPDGAEIKVFSQNRDALSPQPGDAVMVTWSPGHTVVVRG